MPSLQTSVFGPYEFVVRRLHSLVGLIPIGAYMVIHLVTNASLLDGAKTFQGRVDQINSLGPTTLTLVEWTFIFLPILFHGIVGLIIVLRGERNVAWYPYVGNFRYTLQRWTGVIAFVFILYHVFHMHGWFRAEWWHDYVARPLGGAKFNPQDAAATAAAAIQSSWGGRGRVPGGRVGLHLPFCQWPVDDGHHVGDLDDSQFATVGQHSRGCGGTVVVGRGAGSPVQHGNIPGGAGHGEGKSVPYAAGCHCGAAVRNCPAVFRRISGRRTVTMARPRVVVVGGGLAGLAATMKLAELEADVDLLSLVVVRRSHSVCAQGGINSVNELTRQLGDTEWKHFDDTVYGGDFSSASAAGQGTVLLGA